MPWTEQARKGRWPPMTDADYLAKWKANCDILPNGCWHWKGWKVIGKFMYDRERGYPEAGYRGKRVRLNRLIAGWNIGRPLTNDEVGCHTCDYPPCINPEHLWAGTVSDNTQDRIAKGRDHHSSLTHCPRGHSYEEHGRRIAANGHRACKVCQRGRLRMQAGWPEELAYSIEPVPKEKLAGLSIRWERRGNKPTSSRRNEQL